MNTVSSKKVTRFLQAIGYGLSNPFLLKNPIRETIKSVYREGALKSKGIKTIPLDQSFDVKKAISLQDFAVREGNVSAFELMVIALIIANKKPQNLLEIGTFDGTTTLQMALNVSSDALINTIDLPNESNKKTHLPVAKADLSFIHDERKQKRKYAGSSVENKMIQHFGDSTLYDFGSFVTRGVIDFCFIDGGHSYPCVKSDTENTLRILSPQGIILWHDFDPNCPGVYRYLCELSTMYPLSHIEGTQFVIFMS